MPKSITQQIIRDKRERIVQVVQGQCGSWIFIALMLSALRSAAVPLYAGTEFNTVRSTKTEVKRELREQMNAHIDLSLGCVISMWF